MTFGAVGPPFWSDRPALLVGGGPSLAGFDFRRLSGAGHIVGINQAMFDCDVEAGISIDHPFVRRNQTALCAFAARSELYLAVGDYRAAADLPDVPRAVYLRNSDMSEDGSGVFLGGTSGYAALVVALLKSARRIVLLGFDYGRRGDSDHYHDAYRGTGAPADDASWRRWARNFDDLAPQIQRRGIEVINASPTSRITCFPKCSLEDALDAFV